MCATATSAANKKPTKDSGTCPPATAADYDTRKIKAARSRELPNQNNEQSPLEQQPMLAKNDMTYRCPSCGSGNTTTIVIARVSGNRVSVGIEAPLYVTIDRPESRVVRERNTISVKCICVFHAKPRRGNRFKNLSGIAHNPR